METICLIGLGTISLNHYAGLTDNGRFRLIGVCDTSAAAVGRSLYADYPFYADHRRMIGELRPDWVVVTTPPASHAAIATDALGMGCSVIVEKPTAMSLRDVVRIGEASTAAGRYFETAYHWRYGGEAIEAAKILGRYGDIEHIRVSIQDPYSADGRSIDADKLGLGGTFLDSGSNAVSLLYGLVDFGNFRLTGADYTPAANSDLPIHSLHRFGDAGVTAEIEVDWRGHTDRKATTITFRDRSTMRIEHSEQTIYYRDEPIWSDRRLDRLTAHYYNYYNLFEPSAERARELYGISVRIAEIWEGHNDGRK